MDKSLLTMLVFNGTPSKYITSLQNKTQLSLNDMEWLSTHLKILPREYVINNVFYWLKNCVVQINDPFKENKLILTGKIVERLGNDHEFSKKLLSDYMTKILDTCISSLANPLEMEAGLSTLTVCSARYGSWFGPHKSKIELFLFKFLFSNLQNLVKKAGEAFLQLQQIGSSGIDKIIYSTNFSSAFHKLSVTVQQLFDKIFENETEVEHYDFSNDEGFPFPQCDASTAAVYIQNCIVFLKIMLVKKFSAVKTIKPVDILNLINRGHSIHLCVTSEKSSSQYIELASSLIQIQTSLIELLNTYIIWSQGNSLPFSYSITKIFIDSLPNSRGCKCHMLNSDYNEKVYRVLIRWLNISRCALHMNFQTRLIESIMLDITPSKHATKLLDRKKQISRQKKTVDDSSSEDQHSFLKSFKELEIRQQERNCVLALDALTSLLNNCWLRVDVEKLQAIYSLIMSILLEVVTSNHIHPYTHLICQEKLFEVLLAFHNQDNLLMWLDIKLALNILNKGCTSKNLRIATLCVEGVSHLEILCQPLYSPCYESKVTAMKQSEKHDLSSNNDLLIVTKKSENFIEEDEIREYNGISQKEETTDINDELESTKNDSKSSSWIQEREIEHENDLHKEHAIKILDVQILKPSQNGEMGGNILETFPSECAKKGGDDGIYSLDMNCDENIDCNHSKIEYDKSTESVQINDNQSSKKVESDEIQEPPCKTMKLEIKSEDLEEIDDEFVDEIKEY